MSDEFGLRMKLMELEANKFGTSYRERRGRNVYVITIPPLTQKALDYLNSMQDFLRGDVPLCIIVLADSLIRPPDFPFPLSPVDMMKTFRNNPAYGLDDPSYPPPETKTFQRSLPLKGCWDIVRRVFFGEPWHEEVTVPNPHWEIVETDSYAEVISVPAREEKTPNIGQGNKQPNHGKKNNKKGRRRR